MFGQNSLHSFVDYCVISDQKMMCFTKCRTYRIHSAVRIVLIPLLIVKRRVYFSMFTFKVI